MSQMNRCPRRGVDGRSGNGGFGRRHLWLHGALPVSRKDVDIEKYAVCHDVVDAEDETKRRVY